MARKIKFPLEMADGFKVHNGIDELREHFDIDSVLKHYFSGKLERWLRDRYIEKEAEAIAALDKESADLSSQLCNILGVKTDGVDDVNIEHLERLNEKEAFLRQRTDDKRVLANARITALTQADLADLLGEGTETIYLYGDNFDIQLKYKNKTYIGINNPKVSVDAKTHKEIENNNIKFVNVILPDGLKAGENEAKAEKLYLENKIDEAMSIFEEEAKKGNLRAYYFLADNAMFGFGGMAHNKEFIIACCDECLKSDDPVIKARGIYRYLITKDTRSFEYNFSKIKNKLFNEALKGNLYAAYEILQLYLVIQLKGTIECDVPDEIMEKCSQIIISHNYCKGIIILGELAYNDGDYETANNYFLMTSKLGYPWAPFYLGRSYENGFGFEKDLDKAFKLYKTAAENGIYDAIGIVADCYHDGYMVDQDYFEAVKWYLIGVDKNDAHCQTGLGLCYYYGEGVEEDKIKSFLLYQKAAEQGDAFGQYLVGVSFYFGDAVFNGEAYVKDYFEAFKWFQKAANQGITSAMYYLGECYYYGDGVKQDYFKAKEWYERAAEGGHENAKEKLQNNYITISDR